MDITTRIARRGVENKARLGSHRWVVKRTHAWFASFGKLRIRIVRRLDIHVAIRSLVLPLSVQASRMSCVGNSFTVLASAHSVR